MLPNVKIANEHQRVFSIVVLAKDEEQNISFVLEMILERFPPEKIIVVVDGNLEPTASILAAQNIKYIVGPGKGKGAAIRAAIHKIESDILVFIDADGSHNPNEIEELLVPLMNDEADMVVGSRFLGGSEELSHNFENYTRMLGNLMSNFLVNFIWCRTDTNISDSQNGFRAIKRTAFLNLDLVENSFSIEQEMVIKCMKKAYRIKEIPSFELKRRHGCSHISNRHLFCYIGCLLKNLFKE